MAAVRNRIASLLSIFVILSLSQTAKSDQGTAQATSGDGIPFQQKESCAVALCGAVPKKITPPDLAAKAAQVFDTKLSKGLDTWMSLIAKNRSSIADVEQNKAAYESLNLTDNFKKIVNFQWADTFGEAIEPYLTNQGTETAPKFVVSEKFREALPQLKSSDQDLVKGAIELAFNSEEFRIDNALENLDLQSAMMQLYPNQISKVPLAQLKIQFAKDRIDKLKQLQQLMPEIPVRIPMALVALANGKDLDEGELKAISQSVSIVFMLKIIQSPLFAGRTPDLKALIEAKLKSAPYLAFKGRLGTAQADRADLKSKCQVALTSNFAVDLSPQEISKAQSVAKEVQDSAINQTKQLFSFDPAKASALAALIQKARFRFPPTFDELISEARSQIANGILEERLIQQKSSKFETLFNFLNVADHSLFSEVGAVCDQLTATPYTDNARTTLGLISTGWETVRTPETGRTIMAHELGHVLFADLATVASKISPSQYDSTTQKFARLLGCIGSRQNTFDPLKTSNEDFADWFASHVMTDLNSRGIVAKNFGCALLGGDGTRYGTLNGLTLKWPGGYDDVHSPSLLRLLEFEVNSGKTLPPICSDLMSKNMPPQAMKRCDL